MSAILELHSVNKTIGDKKILNDVSFGVQHNQFACIVGPSGCGKSTLLKLIAGVTGLDSGRIFVNGNDVTAQGPAARKISIVFQDYSLYPTMTVFDNIALGLKINKVDGKVINAKVSEIVGNLNLEAHVKKYPSQLSGGQQQRVAFARALVMNSDIVLLDEPFSAIDVQIKMAMQEDLLELKKKFNLTILLVTHDLEEALTLGDYVIVMNRGAIVKTGTSDEIYNTGDNEFVQEFVVKQVTNKYRNLQKIIERR